MAWHQHRAKACVPGIAGHQENHMAKAKPKVSIIMRSRNDHWIIRDTIAQVQAQHYRDFELLNFDSMSDDGTFEIIKEMNSAANIFQNDPKQYIPGKVLNDAVTRADGDILVFLNSDATPTDRNWLENLIAPLHNPGTGAVFGQQSPRPDCRALFAKDTRRAFGDGRIAAQWRHFFSMANSATRRDILEKFPFDPALQFSEDIEWSYRLKKAGYAIAYVAAATTLHSHNYTLKQSFIRHYGEGRADAWIFADDEIKGDFLHLVLAPVLMENIRDIIWAAQHASLDALLHTLPLRIVQKYARWRGFKAGLNTLDEQKGNMR